MIKVDTHVHSVLSGHAFSTVWENAKIAKERGLKAFASTDHGPMVPGSPPGFHPGAMRLWPTHVEGIRLYKSCEANIKGPSGVLDIPLFYLKMLDFVVAGLHFLPEEEFGVENSTKALVAAYNNPYMDVVSHPDNPHYPVDFERLVKVAKRNGKPIEINHQSILLRSGSRDNAMALIALCKENDTMVVAASDAHICFNVGDVSAAEELLNAAKFPEELILNANFERFEQYLKKREARIKDFESAEDKE